MTNTCLALQGKIQKQTKALTGGIMKDRLVELSSPLALPIHPHLSYPQQHRLAGQPLQAVGVVRGRPVWPVFGGAPEGDSDGGAGTGDESTDDDGSGGSDDDEDSKKEGGDPQKKIAALTEEKDRHFQKRKEAETELEELRKYKKAKDAESQTETERLTSERDEAVATTEAQAATISALQLEIAFLSDNKYSWQNPKRALKLVDFSEVEVKDGKVVGMDKALEALAKSDPYLLKADKEENDEGTGGPTGKQHNGKKKTSVEPDRKALLAKFPALRGR